MDVLLRAAALAVTGAVLGLVLKKNSPEISLLLTVAVSCAVLYLAISLLTDVLDFITGLTELTNVSSTSVSAIMKAVGIGIITRLTADVCKDSGQNAAASSVELAGTAAALFVAMPLMKTVLEMIKSLL